jgi:hypothetical protein
MFGRAPIIKVKNVDLGSYLADGTGSRPESVIKTAMDSLYSNKIPQRFEWARNEWRERGNPIRSAAGQRAYYRLMSAIIRTKWGKTDEYLFVHWPYNNLNVFIRGRQWIDAFNAAIKAGEKPSLGEVCTLFYFRIS